MTNLKKFIDFDGVIYDTEKRVVKQKNENSDLSWDEFFEQLDWYQLLDEAKVINDAISILLNAQYNKENIAILTKVHTLLEAEAKIMKMRRLKIKVPILIVPPYIRKSEIYCPSNGEILVDDSVKNLIDWENKGGKGIYFNEDGLDNCNFTSIKTLKKVL